VIHPDLNVLYMSGYPDDAVLGHGLAPNGARLAQKPFSKSDLASRLREALRNPGATAAEG
jgi:two-component system, cell cycle sensor histidine kinase and response regulator CckA